MLLKIRETLKDPLQHLLGTARQLSSTMSSLPILEACPRRQEIAVDKYRLGPGERVQVSLQSDPVSNCGLSCKRKSTRCLWLPTCLYGRFQWHRRSVEQDGLTELFRISYSSHIMTILHILASGTLTLPHYARHKARNQQPVPLRPWVWAWTSRSPLLPPSCFSKIDPPATSLLPRPLVWFHLPRLSAK
jgi:hypothetical protein